MRRRGSHSANMLKPSVAVVQGEQQQQLQQQQQQPQHRQQPQAGTRRSSLPSFRQGINGVFGSQPPQAQAPAGQPQSIHSFSPQRQNGMQWQQQQQDGMRHSHHGYSSSMDLMSTARSSASNGNSSFPQFQNSLFRSSSHHTSHTAAAGDLLTMSRRSLDPPLPSQGAITKKRSASTAGPSSGNAGQFNFTSMHKSNSTGGQHHFQFSQSNSQQQQPLFSAPQHHRVTVDHGPGLPTPQATQVATPFGTQVSNGSSITNYVSSSTIGTMGDNDESHHEHRTIRRCRRSDSFEMMEDG